MSKVSTEDKILCQEQVKNLRDEADVLLEKIKEWEKDNIKNTDQLNDFRMVAIAVNSLEVCQKFCDMSAVTQELLKIKNENYQNEARKNYIKALVSMEKVVGEFLDVPFGEISDKLEHLRQLTPPRVLAYAYKFRDTHKHVVEQLGENSKWKLSFIEMEGRYTTILKNSIDYKVAQASQDPRAPYYVEYITLIKNVKEFLMNSAQRYRDKYMLITKEGPDMRKAIEFEEVYKKISGLFNFTEEAETAKKTIDSWKAILDKEEKDKDRGKSSSGGGKAKKEKKKGLFGF